MPFSIRPYHRFPACCPVPYHAGLFEDHGTVWDLSLNGWRLSGDLPLRVGETCSFTIHLPNQQSIYVAAAIVRWIRGREAGLESLLVEKQTHARLALCETVGATTGGNDPVSKQLPKHEACPWKERAFPTWGNELERN